MKDKHNRPKPVYHCEFRGLFSGHSPNINLAWIVRKDTHKVLGSPNGRTTITSLILRIDFEKKEMETENSIYYWGPRR